MLALMLAAAIAGPPPDGEQSAAAAAPSHVLLHPTGGCDNHGSNSEVVVCGDKDVDARYRLRPVDGTRYQDKPLRAETKLGGGTAALAAAPVKVGGWQSNRIMITLKFPF